MKTSLYNKTKNYNGYRYYYNDLNIGYADSDIIIIVSNEYHHKPGKLAQDLYGSPRYAWVFRYFNPNLISDIIFDLSVGMVLRVPTKERLLSIV
jgi:hypothetical protein